MLEITNLSKSFKDRRVISNVNLSINRGEIIGLLGPNGAGKTTIFYMIAGLMHPDGGKIVIENEEITNFPMHERAKKGLVYLPQEPSIFQSMTVWENIYGSAELLYRDKNKIKFKTESVISALDLEEILHQKGRTLSGGQRRRVEIARCLLFDPKIILLDEPFAGVDPLVVDEINKILKDLILKKVSVLITDHNVTQTLSICDRSYIINEGQVIASGSRENLMNNNLVKEKYFGKLFE
ncbi:MAG: LPS export ABC transporter ATP-binding protein [Gammaproteobacteria bacterium]